MRGWPRKLAVDPEPPPAASTARPLRAGPVGLGLNLVAVLWGLFVVVNMSWPRAAIYGPTPGAASPRCWRRRADRARSALLPDRAAATDRDPGRARVEPRAGDRLRPAIVAVCGRFPRTDRTARGDDSIASGMGSERVMLKLRSKARDSKRRRAVVATAATTVPPTRVRAVPGLVRPRLHRTGAGGRRR